MIELDAVATQLEAVRDRYPAAEVRLLPDGTRFLEVPGVPVGPGYSVSTVTVRFTLPAGYPRVGLDCFYTDLELTLAGGAPPQNTGVQPLGGQQLRWFSWHVSSWDAQRDDLDHFLRTCESRLRNAM